MHQVQVKLNVSFTITVIVMLSSMPGASAVIILQSAPDLALPQTHSLTRSAPAIATSHQSFTRVHNPDVSLPQAQVIHASDFQVVAPRLFQTSYVASLPQQKHTTLQDHPPVVSTLVHTPAHLTYAATPIVYKMLPQIKPVRSISYESLASVSDVHHHVHVF